MDTPSKALPVSHRLLYRGSLSLPDSHLLLDGLSFTVNTNDTHGSPALMNNTLALTLESLRGLPLHLIGTVRVKDTWIDPVGDINLDVHPDSTLTRIYFENLFCLTPITSADSRTDYGVRVSLTDNDDPATPDLLIYGELRDSPSTSEKAVPSTSSSAPKVLHLLAARILPGPPPPPSFRLPRPDDPTPRRPPVAFGSKRKRDASGIPFDLTGSSADSGKRAKTTDSKGKGRAILIDEEAMRKVAAETMRRMPKPQKAPKPGTNVNVRALGKDARVGAKVRDDVFKVPGVPVRRSTSEPDVFGSASVVKKSEDSDPKLKRDNKTAVKTVVTQALATKGIEKTHTDFKELFQMCYQGACFALRHRIGSSTLDGPIIEHFVDAHIKLYVYDTPP